MYIDGISFSYKYLDRIKENVLAFHNDNKLLIEK